jgi:PAS domain S-box-containing protein
MDDDAGLRNRDAHAIVDAALDGVVTIDAAGTIREWNPQAESVFGWTRQEVLGRSLAETIIPEQYRAAHLAGLARFLATGEARVLNKRIEVAGLHRDGHEFPIELSIAPIGSGDDVGFCAFVRNITERHRAEQSLRESEERFRTMADTAPVLIWISGTDKLCTWFNRRWLEFVGRTMEQETGNGWIENVHADDLEQCVGIYSRSFDAREPFQMTYRLRRHDGQWRWILDHGAPSYDTEGEFTGYVGSCVDVTEQLDAANALNESRQHYQTLSESLPHLVWTCMPDGWCDYLSRQWVEYTGRAAEEQLGYGWADQLHPDDRERVQAAWAQATVRGDRFDIEFRIRRADGVYRWFKTRALPLRNRAGAITKWFGSNTDFDEHKRAEEKLHAQLEALDLLDRITRAIGERQDLRSIFQVVVSSLEDQLPLDFACVCLYDRADRVLEVSCVGGKSRPIALDLAMPEGARIEVEGDGLARCVGGELVYDPETAGSSFAFPRRLAGAGLRSLVAAPLVVEEQVFGVLVAARRARTSFSSRDCEFLRQLSAHVALAAHQARLHEDLQAAYEDLRQTQQSVMQQERLRSLGQMASGIAHDINNAISPVALLTQSLLEHEPALSDRGRDFLTTIGHAVDDVAATVARMKEFYRQREPQLVLTPVNLNELVKQVINLTRARWSDMPQHRGLVIALSEDLARDLPWSRGIENEIREALTNLVFNAVDAMPEGGKLTLRTRVIGAGAPSGTSRSRIAVEVIDTGLGMDDETRRRCLEPFFTTKGERGTGLGLAMVYGVTQRHGADIEIESAPGKGTVVRLVFPTYATSVEAARVTKPPAKPRPMRILVIDDDPLVLKALTSSFQFDGHTVSTAGGGREGIAAFAAAQGTAEPFAVVITDLGMPHMDGRAVARGIKEISRATPVIMLTGWGHRLAIEGEIPPHVDRLLNKPPRLNDLREALAALTAEGRVPTGKESQ